MTGYILVLVVCCTGGEAGGEPSAPTAATVDASPVTTPQRPVDQLRSRYRRAMQASARRSRPEPAQVVPDLVALYTELRRSPRPVEGLSLAERRRMLGALEGRLKQLRTRLRTELRREKRKPRTSASTAVSAVGTGGTAARAQELIRLIENTIAPDTWEANGGRGRIMFWPNPPALVIRQTGEVHHQVGALLGTLRDP